MEAHVLSESDMPCNDWKELASAVTFHRLEYRRVASNGQQAVFGEIVSKGLMEKLRAKLIRAWEAADRHRSVCPICRSEPPEFFRDPDPWTTAGVNR